MNINMAITSNPQARNIALGYQIDVNFILLDDFNRIGMNVILMFCYSINSSCDK